MRSKRNYKLIFNLNKNFIVIIAFNYVIGCSNYVSSRTSGTDICSMVMLDRIGQMDIMIFDQLIVVIRC